MVFSPTLVQTCFQQSGFFSWLYGPDFNQALESKADPAAHQLALARATVWGKTVNGPIGVGITLLLLAFGSGARLYQLGLTKRHLGRNLLIGVLSGITLTPLVFALNEIVTFLWKNWGWSVQEHPLTLLVKSQPLPLDWILLGLSSTLMAPATEELLFRGLLQPWCATRPHGNLIVLAAALVLTAWLGGFGPAGLASILFVLVMLPGGVWLHRLPHGRISAAIYATALLFGAAHGGVWPTPIALFVLALGYGFVAYRTQSVVPSMVAHALNNGAMVVLLMFPQFVPDLEKGKEATDAGLRVPAISTSSPVPGSR